MDRHCDNALALANWLFDRDEVETLKYPHHPSHPQFELAKRQMTKGGGIVSFTLKGGLDRGRRFLDALKMCSLTANLGDVRTIATHPASTTHSKLTESEQRAVGIEPGLIRISVGLEHIDDIIGDIQQALEASS
jgi:O-succinylhomoserine sulfhydrylase